MQRVAFSLLALPVVLWVLVALVAWLFGQAPVGMRLQDAAMLGTYLALFTYVAMGIVTVPLLLLCFWRKWQTIWHAAGVGAITGALPFAAPLVVQLFDERLHLHYRLQQLALVAANEFVGIGVCGGALFWFMAVWRNATLSARFTAHKPELSTSSAA